MPLANYVQTNFLGGEWSPFFQGRSDHKNYRSAMNVCRNGYPIEEGTWVRRSGTRLVLPTFKGKAAKLYPLAFEAAAPYQLEFSDDGTDGYIRFFNGTYPVITSDLSYVASISTANPAEVTLQSIVPWATGDEVAFIVPADSSGGRPLRMRTFLITTVALSFPAYSGSTTYGIGETVSSVSINYISLVAGNLNNTPASNPTKWAVVAAGSTNKFTIKDSITAANIDGSTLNITTAVGMVCVRLLRVTTPYVDGTWETARVVQNQDVALVLNGTDPPQVLTVQQNIGSVQVATAQLVEARFIDGPYFDPVKDSQATISGGLTGVVTMTVAFKAYDSTHTYATGDYVTSGGVAYRSLVNSNLNHTPASSPTFWTAVDSGIAVTGDPNAVLQGFQDTDVGRLVRLFSTPAAWAAGTYNAGNTVYWQLLVYVCQTNGTTTQPDLDAANWKIADAGAIWTWGKITAVTNGHTVTIQIMGADLLYSTPVNTWRLGVYSDTTGYPTCGLFHEGRFWLGGAQPNRFDSTMTGGVTKDGQIYMSPTGPGSQNVAADNPDVGTVSDNNAISYTLQTTDLNPIMWMVPDHLGIVLGTQGGEWLVSASQLSDPLTPTSIQAHRVTKYGCADVEPRRTGIALVFVQKFKRKIMEFLSDVFTGRFIAPHLSEPAKHLTVDQVQEIAYQEELAPILWARTGNATTGAIVGATYRRQSTALSQESPSFVGWHRHDLGTERVIESISVGGNYDGTLDSLAMVTNDTATNIRWVEMMAQMFDEDDTLYDAWFLDGAIVPDSMWSDTVAGQDGIRFGGLWPLIGDTVTVWVGGLDVGEFTVESDGTVFVPFGDGVAPSSFDYTVAGAGAYLFTQAYIDAILALNLTPRNGGVGILTFGIGGAIDSKTVTSLTATSKVQSFINGSGSTQGLSVDWTGGYLVTLLNTNLNIITSNINTGAVSASTTIDSITGGTTDGAQIFEGAVATSGEDGKSYLPHNQGVVNFCKILKYTESTLVKVFDYGTPNNSPGPPGTPSMGDPKSMCVSTANAPWVISCASSLTGIFGVELHSGLDGSFIAGNGQTSSNYSGLSNHSWELDEGEGYCAAGAPLIENNLATAYIVSPSTTAIGIYCMGVMDGIPTNPQTFEHDPKFLKQLLGKGPTFTTVPSTDTPLFGFAKIGTISPSQVDADWSGLNFATTPSAGCAVDQSDNSVLTFLQVGTTTAYSGATTYAIGDKVTSSGINYVSLQNGNLNHTPASSPTFWRAMQMQYFIKITTGQYSRTLSGTFGVAWKVPVKTMASASNFMGQSKIKNGLYIYLDNSNVDGADRCLAFMIDTTTGLYRVLDVPGITAVNHRQACDDTTQSVIVNCSYNSAISGAPTGLNGTTDFSNTWARIFPGADLPVSGTIPGTNGSVTPSGYTIVYTSPGGLSSGLPAVIGAPFTSQGQILRPIAPEQAGTRTGPAFASIRRPHYVKALLHNTIGIQFGVDFSTSLQPASLKDEGGTQPDPTTMYSGLWRETVNGKYDFDGMIAWQILRPYPASVISIGASEQAQDA